MTNHPSEKEEGNPSRRSFLRQLGLLAGASVMGERSAAHAAALLQQPRLTDEQICSMKFDIALRESLADRPIGEVMVALGGSFLGTPYGAHTLELPGAERLIVNLRELDCVTFVESTLALARCVKLGTHTLDAFRDQLRTIRYRHGSIDGYPSRLHYFSDWIDDNAAKGMVRDVTRELGGVPYAKEVRFMSTHPDAYRQLAERPVLDSIRVTEETLNSRGHWYLPTDQLAENIGLLEAGDILGITTAVEGLDIAHTGIAAIGNGVVRYLHAPLSKGTVQLSEHSLVEYLRSYRNHTGVMVARPSEPAHYKPKGDIQ